MAQKRIRGIGSVTQLRRKLWNALIKAERVLNDSYRDGDKELTLKGAHCLSQLAGQYHKIVVEHELEQRIEALEQQAHQGSGLSRAA